MKVLPVDMESRQIFERKILQKISVLHVIQQGFGSKVMKIKNICNYIEKNYRLVI